MGRRRAHWPSPRPICVEPYCGKVWAPTRAAAVELWREVALEKGGRNQVRFYECSGGWHWSSRLDSRDM